MMTRTLALLTMLVLSAPATALPATLTRISVSGHGTVAVDPNQATIRATIQTNADRAADATSQNNAVYARTVNALTASGIARSDITLAYYNLNYNPRPSSHAGEIAPAGVLYGYIVNRAFDVKVRDIAKAGSVVDALTRAGVTNVENVAFDVADPSHARSEAIGNAVAEARGRAENAAHAAGLHVTGIESIGLDGNGRVAPLVKSAITSEAFMTRNAPAPTAFDSGSVNVTADVTVVFLAQP
jgi:hypothetical protein